jgi:hypothetical protein
MVDTTNAWNIQIGKFESRVDDNIILPDRHCWYNAVLRGVRITIFAVKKLLAYHILSVCL